MDEIMALAREHGLAVIEDGAPSLGAEYKGRKVGTIGRAGCFSFQGAKVAIGGQGGVLVTNDPELFERARTLASYGRTDSVMQYWSDFLGFNYTMPNLPAALALAQLQRLEELIAKKREIFRWYQDGLEGVRQVKLIKEARGTRSTCCYPAALLCESSGRSREEVLAGLKKDHIDSRPAQPRISGMPMFERRFDNPVSRQVEARGLILPSAFNLTEDDVQFVCRRLRDLAQ
jgi:perosamine synthetase